MIPSSPIRGLVSSALSIDALVAGVEGVDALRLERLDRTHRAGEMDDPRGVLAHHGGLDRLARAGADSEHAVVAHEDGGGALRGDCVDDSAADLLVADQGERADRD